MLFVCVGYRRLEGIRRYGLGGAGSSSSIGELVSDRGCGGVVSGVESGVSAPPIGGPAPYGLEPYRGVRSGFGCSAHSPWASASLGDGLFALSGRPKFSNPPADTLPDTLQLPHKPPSPHPKTHQLPARYSPHTHQPGTPRPPTLVSASPIGETTPHADPPGVGGSRSGVSGGVRALRVITHHGTRAGALGWVLRVADGHEKGREVRPGDRGRGAGEG